MDRLTYPARLCVQSRRRVSATKLRYQRFGQTGAPQPRRGLAGPGAGRPGNVVRRAAHKVTTPVRDNEAVECQCIAPGR
jgi:hypothetical protein